MKLWIQDFLLKTISLKAIHLKLFVQDLVLKTIKLKNNTCYFRKLVKRSKDHLKSFERQLKLWEEGVISNLLHKGETIQERMKDNEKGMNTEKILLRFKT